MESHTIVRAISESENSHFQNEANCKMSENEFYLHENKKSFSYRWFRTLECFHMTSWRPYWCPKTMKRQPCWCPQPILWELNSFLMQTPPFVPINLRNCWPRERKHSIAHSHTFKISKRCFFLEKVWPSHKVHVRSFLDEIKN